MKNLYETSDGFRQYVDRYCQKEGTSPDVAFTHSVIRNAYEYYKDAEEKKISVTEVKAGCGAAMGECK